ncbi:MAG: NADPH-dependent F420 reductase [Actinobacteria bacterium]|nr:NADPH-dependent F420 reductase [Actinomycetota bacterium]
MSSRLRCMDIGIIGGTGPLGRGLATRFAAAGLDVRLGSRDPERAAKVVTDIAAMCVNPDCKLTGVSNMDAAAAEVVFVTTPWDGAVSTVKPLAGDLAGKPVVSTLNALVKTGREFLPMLGPRGSMAGLVAAALPQSMVVAAGHHLPASVLCDIRATLQADILLCSDHPTAKETVSNLLRQIEGIRCLDAGSLAQSGALEAFTAVLININMRYGGEATVAISGLAG